MADRSATRYQVALLALLLLLAGVVLAFGMRELERAGQEGTAAEEPIVDTAERREAAVWAATLEGRIEEPKLGVIDRDLPDPQQGYEFTNDNFTYNIPVWEAALARFRGQAGVRYLEIGTWEGRSVVWMLEEILTDETATAVGIDPYSWEGGDAVEAMFLRNVEKAGGAEKFTLIRGYSQIELRTLELGSFDIIYIDGSHRADDVLEDAVLCRRLLAPGGVLIFDDYQWKLELPLRVRPEKSISDFMWYYGEQFEVLHAGYQLILTRPEETPTETP